MLKVTKSVSFHWSLWTSLTVLLAYMVVREFNAVWALFIILPAVAIAVTFIVVFVRSIMFWISNRSTIGYPFLPLFINVFCIIIISFFMPPIYTGKHYHKGTYLLNGNKYCTCKSELYTERYLAASGFMTTDLDAVYITDKKNFRLYAGVDDENVTHRVNITCQGDKITVTEISLEGISEQWSNPKLMKKLVFSFKELKANHQFD
jgi:hypothetical protein